MHNYLRSVGFASVKNRTQLEELTAKIVSNAGERIFTSLNDDEAIGVLSMEVAPGIGVSVCGEMNEDNKFFFDYLFPYARGLSVSSYEDITVERHIEKESYSGVCEDPRVGITLIFYLQNVVPYIRAKNIEALPIRKTSVTFSALATEGTIIMPLRKSEASKKRAAKFNADRIKLIEEARSGNEKAMEDLTLGDMDIYSSLYKKLQTKDMNSLVDTFIMPYGVECELYSIMGEIVDFELVTNKFTGEEIYKLQIEANDIPMLVCINKEDLYGEPEISRRFKGVVWLQGYVNYDAE